MNKNNLIYWVLNPVTIGIGAASAVAMMLVVLFFFSIARPNHGVRTPATAVFNIIQAPTPTQSMPTPTVFAAPSETPTGAIPNSSENIAIGAFVQIRGTEGDGLRIRSEPGLESQVRFLAYEDEVFQVRDGPRQNSGYNWWSLVAPYDETVQGWAVSSYLVVVQNP